MMSKLYNSNNHNIRLIYVDIKTFDKTLVGRSFEVNTTLTVQIWSEYSYDSVDLKWIQLWQCRFEVDTAMTV